MNFSLRNRIHLYTLRYSPTKHALESEIQTLMETIKGYTTWSPTGSEALSEMFIPFRSTLNPEVTQKQSREEFHPYVRGWSKPGQEKTKDSGD